MVTNAYDRAVNKDVIAELVENWRQNGALNVKTYEFPAELEFGHDLISPDHPFQNVDAVYPVLLELLTE